MKRFVFPLLMAVVLMFGACKKEGANDGLTHIPADAGMVTSFNLGELAAKADYENIKNKPEFQQWIADQEKEYPGLAAALRNPTESGIDLSKNIYFTTIKDPKSGESFTGAVVTIADATKFAKMVGGNDGDKKMVTRQGFTVHEGGNTYAAWNGETGYLGQISGSGVEKVLFSKPEKSIAQNGDISKALQKKHDVQMWFSSDNFISSSEVAMYASMVGLPAEALKGNSVSYYLDFNTGQVDGHADFLLNKQMREHFGIMMKNGVKADFSRMVSDEPGITFTSALDFKGIEQFMKEQPSLASLLDMSSAEKGVPVSINDITRILDGDIMLHMVPNGSTFNGILAAKIRDTKHLNDMLDLGAKAGILKKMPDGMYQIKADTKSATGGTDLSYILLDGDMLMLSGNQNWLSTLAAKKSIGSGKSAAITAAKNNIMTMSMSQGVNPPKGLVMFANPGNAFELNINGNGADFKMPMDNKTQNSLKTLIERSGQNNTPLPPGN